MIKLDNVTKEFSTANAQIIAVENVSINIKKAELALLIFCIVFSLRLILQIHFQRNDQFLFQVDLMVS